MAKKKAAKSKPKPEPEPKPKPEPSKPPGIPASPKNIRFRESTDKITKMK